MTQRSLLFIVNVDSFFISHRLRIAQAARDLGYAVHIACKFSGSEDMLRAEGFAVHPIRLERASGDGFGQLRALWDIAAVIRSVRPDIVHLVTIKPVLLGGIAARLLRVPRVVAAISGLGFIFIAKGWKAVLRRRLIGIMYRLALGGRHVRVIFQNEDDRALISALAGIGAEQVRMIKGSGVDLARFTPRPLPPGRLSVVMASRLLIDKGVREFVEAARILTGRGLDVRFVLAGERDPVNPACVPADEIEAWRRDGLVEMAGHVRDLTPVFAAAHVVVLPSYREGMPLVLLEAAASGRAVVTSDAPGCRDAIVPEETGLLVAVRDSRGLADAIARLASNPDLCAEMGQRARALAEREFSIEDVVRRHLEIYAEPTP